MPIYEYRCSACGHKLESLQKLADAPLVTCPSCGKPTLTKLVSAAGFQLKGSGWYATDFKGSGSKPVAKPEDAASASKDGDSKAADMKTEAKAETASEKKTEAKADSKSETKAASTPAAPPTGSGTPSA
jgi:putative FmdB family regulatory protein